MIALLPLALAALAQDPAPAFTRSDVTLPRNGVQLALKDADGDGDLDLFRMDRNGITVHLQSSAGAFEPTTTQPLRWPSTRLAWDLDDLDGDGATEVLLFVDGAQVQSHQLQPDGKFSEAEEVLQAKGWLPPGSYRVNFARDVDGDGHTDLVLPDQRAHRIYLATPGAETAFAAPLEVRYSANVRYEMGDPGSLDGRFGRSVSVPWFELYDVDGDGTRDLVSQTREQVAFHLADPVLSAEPSWVLDLVELAKQLPKSDGINLDDLLSNIDDSVQWEIADLDGKAPNDFVLGLGGKFQVYLGGSRGGPQGTPDQVLKSSGKVLTFFVRQVLGDARPDLQLLRGERISLGRALRYLILPGRLDFEVYTYGNEGGTFARRPTQRGTLGLEIPRLLSFADDAEGVSKQIDEQFEIPALRLAWDEDAKRDDVADVSNGKLTIQRNCAPQPTAIESLMDGAPNFEGIIEAFVLVELDQRGDEGEVVFGLDELPKYDLAPGSILRQAAKGKAVAAEAAFDRLEQPELRIVDLDGDGRDDVVGWGRGAGTWEVRLFVRR